MNNSQQSWQARQGRFQFNHDPMNGCLVGPDTCHYDTETEAMYYGQLGLCGCGNPTGIHRFLCESIKQFAGEWGKDREGIDGIVTLVKQQPDVAAEFIGHFLDRCDLLEHGGSVYGSWLTDRGKQFLEIGPMRDEDVRP